MPRKGRMLGATFLVEETGSASARTRGHDLVPGLAARGIDARVEGVARGFFARRRQLRALHSRDVVVLARKLLPGWDLALLRRSVRALVFDFDDAVSERPYDVHVHGGGSRSWTRPRRFRETLRAADLVVAGSAHLRDLAGPHPRVRLLPVAVTIPAQVPIARSSGDGITGDVVRLLWSGSRATLPYLERVRTSFVALARRRPRVELEVLAEAPPEGTGIATRFTPWSLEAEEAALARADVGLMPLADDPWSRGKCGFKLARYLAWGVPAVSSRWGAGAEILDAGRTGLLADDEGEWLFGLEALVRDPARRRAMAIAARGDAAARLDIGARIASWAAVLREAAPGAVAEPSETFDATRAP